MYYPQHLLFTKNEAVNQGEGGRREGILKLMVKVSLKFEVIWGFASYKSTKNVNLYEANSQMVSDLRSQTKGSQFESGCQLCAEVSSLQ